MTNKDNVELIASIVESGSTNIHQIDFTSLYSSLFVKKPNDFSDICLSYGIKLSSIVESDNSNITNILIEIKSLMMDSINLVKNFMIENILVEVGIVDNDILEKEFLKNYKMMRINIIKIYNNIGERLKEIYWELDTENKPSI